MEDQPSLFDLLEKRVLTVGELTERIKEAIELEFAAGYVWVEGEVSNFRDNYASGHWYFTLKDRDAQLACVCFRQVNQQIGFVPENGMEVLCRGEVVVYGRQGRYQLNCIDIEPKGVGAEAVALEQLKRKLEAEGLFDPARKRPLPFLPETIGVVTSPSGAAIRDILNVLGRRFPGVGVLISPARVQGEEAPAEIVRALRRLYAEGVDLVIVARGGGSKEDLRPFNDEAVAREIARSPIPVLSAVGHEIDVTIADLVADHRAPTPSAAAEVAVREKAELERELAELMRRAGEALRRKAETAGRELELLADDLERVMRGKIEAAEYELAAVGSKLDALSPLRVLERGYSITQKVPTMEVVTESRALSTGDEVVVTFHRGKARCSVTETED